MRQTPSWREIRDLLDLIEDFPDCMRDKNLLISRSDFSNHYMKLKSINAKRIHENALAIKNKVSVFFTVLYVCFEVLCSDFAVQHSYKYAAPCS